MSECPRHKHCAYTGAEPGLCPTCHASVAKCAGKHGAAPVPGWDKGTANAKHPTLREGLYIDPREAAKASQLGPQPSQRTSVSAA